MHNPLTGDSFEEGTPAIFGWHHKTGIGILGKSEGGTAGSFEGDVEVTDEITLKDPVLTDAQSTRVGLVEQLKALTKRVQDLELPVGCIFAFAGKFFAMAR